MSKVILYDIPSQPPCKGWSVNPWKTRMVLNFKGIDYETEWVEYPDLAPKFKSFGLGPNPKDAPGYFADYSSPAIRYEDGTYSMDSWKIVHVLEKTYPSPPLHLDDPVVIKIRDHISNIMRPIGAHILPKIPRVLLTKPSAEYFERTREQSFGMPLSELEKKMATEQGWEDVKEPAKEVGDLLRKNGGPYFLGNIVSYADFIFVAFLQMLLRLDDNLFQRFIDLDPTFPKVFEASKQWLRKED